MATTEESANDDFLVDVIRCSTVQALHFKQMKAFLGKAPRSYFEEDFFMKFSIMVIEAHCTSILAFCMLKDSREVEFISF